MRASILMIVLVLAAPAAAEPRRIAFWPDAVPEVIQRHVDGGYVLDVVRSLGKFHRVQGSPGMRAAAEWLVGELAARGVAGAAVEQFAADGATSYAHFKSYFGWTASEGRLEQLAPARRVIAEFPRDAVALADYSQDADVAAE